MELQTIFTQVVQHLCRQRVAAVQGGNCMYCAANGNHCAVGCLIPPSLYNYEMENNNLKGILEDNPELAEYLGMTADKFGVLERLQVIHDSCENAQTGHVITIKALDCINFLAAENDLIVPRQVADLRAELHDIEQEQDDE